MNNSVRRLTKQNIYTEAFCEFQNKIYLSDMTENALFIGDENEEFCKIKAVFPEEDSKIWRQHCNAELLDGEIVFLPFRGRHIHHYNVETGQIRAIQLDICDRVFRSGTIYNGFAVLVQSKPSTAIVVADIFTGETFSIPFFEGDNQFGIAHEFALENGKIYTVLSRDNKIYCIDLLKKKVSCFGLQNVKNGCGTICGQNGKLYISSDIGLIEWDIEKNCETLLEIYPKTLDHIKFILDGEDPQARMKESYFGSSLIIGDKIFFLSNTSNINLYYDLKNKSLCELYFPKEVETMDTISRTGRITISHYIGKKFADGCYISSFMTGRLYRFDKINGFKDGLEFKKDPNEKIYLKSESIAEDENLSLCGFISALFGDNK